MAEITLTGKIKSFDKTRTMKFLEDFYYSFPIQLLANHFKKNQILLLLWALMFGFVTQEIGMMVGAPYLFLDPEYMNVVDYRGFFIIGISVGIFIISFHITTYILDSYRFNFLGAVPRPFTKFCFNNSILPIAFVIIYVICIIQFQFKVGFQTGGQIAIEVLSFLAGNFLTLLILFVYFRSTNRDIFKELAVNVDKQLKKSTVSRVNVLKKINIAKKNKYKVNVYLDLPFKIKKVPEYNSYDKRVLLKIFDQNHLNAVIVEIFVIILIIILGLFRDNSYFQIPAAASGILFFSIFIMFTGAFSYWLRGWAITALIIALIGFNFLVKHEVINSVYQAYGINYNSEPAEYTVRRLAELASDENRKADMEKTIGMLENWKKKFNGEKPKMIFVCVSGGGQRAAAWTTRTLQYTDSALGGDVFKHSILITGASGGIVGASYFRELKLRQSEGQNINPYSDRHFKNITKDILNPVIFSLVVNDIFFRFQKFNDGKYEYLKDRGFAFEQQLNRNLDFVLDKKIADYQKAEAEARIPMMIISPTVINDGRKLFISSQPVSYMTTPAYPQTELSSQRVKGIEFQRFFEKQDAKNMRYLSALRMSATFPYITPNVELPSQPAMEIMDAGLSDNYGISNAVKFLHVFREWISQNTSGVIFLIVRDSDKEPPVEKKIEPSIFQKMFSPIGSLYNNWDYLQDFNNDNFLEYSKTWFKGEISSVEFQYIPKPKNWDKIIQKNINPEDLKEPKIRERAVLSWHLTTREKESLKRTILEENNQQSLVKLKNLLMQKE